MELTAPSTNWHPARINTRLAHGSCTSTDANKHHLTRVWPVPQAALPESLVRTRAREPLLPHDRGRPVRPPPPELNAASCTCGQMQSFGGLLWLKAEQVGITLRHCPSPCHPPIRLEAAWTQRLGHACMHAAVCVPLTPLKPFAGTATLGEPTWSAAGGSRGP